MASFQKITLIIAVVILILALVFIGLALTKANEDNWPPLVGQCPDFWVAYGREPNASGESTDETGEPGSWCLNAKDLGTCPASSGSKHQKVNFSNPIFSGTNGDCAKYNWAKKCGVSWDGITYGAANPCDTTTTTE